MSDRYFFIVNGTIEDAGKHRGVVRFDYKYHQTHGKAIECFMVDEKDVSNCYPFIAPSAMKVPCTFEYEETPEEHEEFINSFHPQIQAHIRQFEKEQLVWRRAHESSLEYLRRVRPHWAEARRLDVMWRSAIIGKDLHDIVPEEETINAN